MVFLLRIRWLGVRGYFLFRNSRICLGILEFLGFKFGWLSAAGAGFLAMQSKILMATVSLSAFSTTAVSATGALGAMTAGLTTAGAAFLRLLPVAVIAGLRLRATD